MKRKVSIAILCFALSLSLSACSVYPDRDAEGNPWNRSWEMLGPVLGIEAPGHDYELLENDTVLAGDDTFYASWVTGDPSSWINNDGKTVDLYPAQIYVLLYGCGDAEAAASAMDDFIAREEASFTVTDRRTAEAGGRSYSVISYNCDSSANPYERGISAFSTYDNYVVCIEITCVEDYAEDIAEVMESFLLGCHYAAESN